MSYEICYRSYRMMFPAGVLSEDEFRKIETQDHCTVYGDMVLLIRKCWGSHKCEPDCWPDGVLRSFMDGVDAGNPFLSSQELKFWRRKRNVESFYSRRPASPQKGSTY